jgi:hypothetical protein
MFDGWKVFIVTFCGVHLLGRGVRDSLPSALRTEDLRVKFPVAEGRKTGEKKVREWRFVF